MRTFLGVLLVLLLAPSALRAAFIFQKVADTSSSSSFQQVTNVSVSAAGTVVFQGTLKSGVSGIYAYSNGQITTIADTTQGYTSFATIPAVNIHGDVAFVAKLTDGSTGVYRSSNGVTTTILNSSSGLIPSLGSPSMNDSGQVEFLVGSAVYVGDGNTVQNYQISSGPPAVINNNGIVAVGAADGAYETDGTHQTHISLVTADNSQGYIAMNNHNVAAIETDIAVATGDGTTKTTVATVPLTIDGHTYQYFYNQAGPPINDDGLVALHPFIGTSTGFTQSAQNEALYIGSQLTRVIGTGDALFGSTIATGQGNELTTGFGLQTTRSSFVGDYLAFRYYQANGVEGIALTQVPEPAATIILAAIVPFLSHRRR